MLLKRLGSNWPQHNGDYTGQRFSPLKQINTSNVGSLTRAWAFETRTAIKATTLMVDGVVYFSVPDNVWAADARTGKEIWHFSRTSFGDHLASRGVTLFKNQIYFGTPDAHLISLDAKTGAKNWEVVVADWKFGYYISAAPLVVKDKLLVGMSGDQLDMPGFLEARDLNDGKLVWRWDAIPKPGEPGFGDLAQQGNHGARRRRDVGPGRLRSAAEPDVLGHRESASCARGECAQGREPVHLLARGARRGYGQDEVVHPDVAARHPRSRREPDADSDRRRLSGKPRKLLAMASRSGYYFLLDRATGESLVTVPYGGQNWSAGVDERGQPIPKGRTSSRRSTARSSKERRRTGGRRATARTPGCSMSTPATDSASAT